ncbi:MAG: ornithine cyclodeaminase family protein, partial [Thaumarchaeota archaeon]|nr:ornithine cyclodeaminase family protein [Nitrososphaerota archaeon]
ESTTLADIGSGQQARAILEAVCCVRKIERASVFSRSQANARQFAKEMGETLGLEILPSEDRPSALKDCDIIIVATNSSSPVIDWREIPSGAHINSVGTLPERREIDSETVRNSSLFVDTKEGVLKEAGDVIHAIKNGMVSEDHIVGDLKDLITGRVKGRSSENQITLFKSVGFALQDVYACDHAYRKLHVPGA